MITMFKEGSVKLCQTSLIMEDSIDNLRILRHPSKNARQPLTHPVGSTIRFRFFLFCVLAVLSASVRLIELRVDGQ